jgi:phenylacetate-CoA ligase
MAAAQVTYVRENSAFYRDRLSPDAGTTPFANLEEFASIVSPVTKAELVAAQSADPPYGPLLAVAPRELVRNWIYPAGQVLALSAHDQDTQEQMYADGLACTGLTADDIVDITFQYGWVAAGTIWDAGAQRLGATVVPGAAGESARHAHNLRHVKATSIIGFPTFLNRIADSAVTSGIDPAVDLSIRHLIIVGEWHSADAKAKLSARFGGAAVREAYGTGETGLVATECEAGEGLMHVHPDVLVEVREATTGELVAEGEPGELYITPLKAHAMPVVRMRTGDITGTHTIAPCSCGRSTLRIGTIIGRVSDLLRVKGSFLSRGLLQELLDEVAPGSGAFHIEVSRPDGMDRLVMRTELVPAEEAVAANLSRRIRERVGVLVEVESHPLASLATVDAWFTDVRQDS